MSDLGSITVKLYKDTESAKALTESGSGDLYDSYILKKCRLKAINKTIGLEKYPSKSEQACAAIKPSFPFVRKFSTGLLKVLC